MGFSNKALNLTKATWLDLLATNLYYKKLRFKKTKYRFEEFTWTDGKDSGQRADQTRTRKSITVLMSIA